MALTKPGTHGNKLFQQVTREQYIQVLNQAYDEFGDITYIARDVVVWVHEILSIAIESRSVGWHLTALGVPTEGKKMNTTVYRLTKLDTSNL